MFRVKNGPCAPLRLSSMLSCPATGTTRIWVTTGTGMGELWIVCPAGATDCSIPEWAQEVQPIEEREVSVEEPEGEAGGGRSAEEDPFVLQELLWFQVGTDFAHGVAEVGEVCSLRLQWLAALACNVANLSLYQQHACRSPR